MSRMHAPNEPTRNPDGNGGAQVTECPVCGVKVANSKKPEHIAKHGDSDD